MISLMSDITDRKSKHARGWLFYDADCKFCTGFAACLLRPLAARGLGMAPLQDPRVGLLLGVSREELLRAIRFVHADGSQSTGVNALLAVAQELWWAQPLVWMAKLPGMKRVMDAGYHWAAQHRSCRAEQCAAR